MNKHSLPGSSGRHALAYRPWRLAILGILASAAEPSGLILNPERVSRSEGRYLTWDPTGAGFNNQRQVLRAACRIAFLLNYTVVLPNKKFSKLHHTHDKTAESYDVYFDFEALKKYVPISTEGQLKGLTANSGEPLEIASNNILTFGSRRTSDTWVAVQDKKELLMHTPFDRGGHFLVYDLDSFHARETSILHLNLKYFWHNHWALSPTLENELLQVELSYFRFNKKIIEISERLIYSSALAKRRGYHAVHLRLKQPRRGFADISRLLTEIPLDRKLVYIATDVPNDVALQRASSIATKRGFRIATFDQDIRPHLRSQDIPPSESNDYIACLEQVICSHAETFIPSLWSSVSEFILFLREQNSIPGSSFQTQSFFSQMLNPHHSFLTNIDAGGRHARPRPNGAIKSRHA